MERHRHVARRAGVDHRGHVPAAAAARYLDFHSFDADYSNGWDIASAMHPQTLLAYAWNDQPLAPNRGAPLRLYSPPSWATR